MTIKINGSEIAREEEYKKIKKLLKNECTCMWDLDKHTIEITCEDKPKDIFQHSQTFEADIKKVRLWFDDFICYLMGRLSFHSCEVGKPIELIQILISGILPLKKVMFVDRAEMVKLKVESMNHPQKDPFRDDRFIKDCVHTEIKMTNLFDLMGYEDNQANIYICPENIADTAEVFCKFHNNNSYSREEMYDIFLKTTFFHELGHVIFSSPNGKNETLKERQANYVSSFATFGEYDDIIDALTKVQPDRYKEPFLSFPYQYLKKKVIEIKKYEEKLGELIKGE